MSMLRSLQRRTHRGRVTFVHYAQSPEHQIFAAELDEVRRSGHGIDVHLLHPELGDPNLSPAYLERLVPGYRDAPDLGLRPGAADRGGPGGVRRRAEALRVEYFQPPRTSGTSAEGDVAFARSGQEAPNSGATPPGAGRGARARRPSSAAGWASASPAPPSRRTASCATS